MGVVYRAIEPIHFLVEQRQDPSEGVSDPSHTAALLGQPAP